MTAADIERVRGAFVSAAQRAVRIGFDAIELHGAHGYLIHSFMSPLSNQRTDEYGGCLENRMRFPLEVARAVRAVVPQSIALGARITGSDWLDGGLTPADAIAFTKALKEVGLRLRRRVVGRHHRRSAHADNARLQRADRRAR